jgi:hypothetical protein
VAIPFIELLDELMPRLLAELDLEIGHRFDFSAAAGDA